MAVLDDAAQLFGDDALQDPYPFYDRVRAEAPVQRIGGSRFYAVCGWDAVLEATARVADFSSNLTATMVFHGDGTVTPFEMVPLDGPAHVLATADDPAHAAHRKVLLPHMDARRIREIESFATETAAKLWTDGLRDGRIEWMSAVANRLPMMVVAKLIGVPDQDVDKLIPWAYATTTLLDGIVSAEQLRAAGMAAFELAGYVADHFRKAAAEPSANLLGDLARRCASGELEEIAGLGMMLTLFSAGGESTSSLLGSAAWILADRPDIQRQVRDYPDLRSRFIEEVLRFEAPFRGHYRHVRADTTLAGIELAADSHLLLMWGAANRDPARFEFPNEFRLDRPTPKASHVTFGRGAHLCVGAALARLEAAIVLRTLLERTTWIEPFDVGRWLPSILVRRLEHLQLTVRQ